jgi:hypothetical protein
LKKRDELRSVVFYKFTGSYEAERGVPFFFRLFLFGQAKRNRQSLLAFPKPNLHSFLKANYILVLKTKIMIKY